MKKFLLGAAALTLAFASCKKDDKNNSTVTPTLSNAVKIGSTSYTYDGINTDFDVTGSFIMITGANGSTGSTLTLSFPGANVPATGTYRVVAADSTKETGEVSFSTTTYNINTSAASAYNSTGAGNVSLTLSQTNGKYTVVLPDAPATGSLGTTGTTTVSANVTQK